MVMVFINGKMEIDMKENGRIVLNMDKELICFLILILTLDNIRMGSLMVQANTNGTMEAYTLENSRMVRKMVMGDGEN